MKYCKKCNSYKNKDEFGILSISKDGLNYNCLLCQRIKMKKWLSVLENRERNNRSAAKHRRTKKGKATKKRYYNSEKGQVHYKNITKRTPKLLARYALNHAVEGNKIPNVNTQQCVMNDGFCNGRMEYHHHKGYDKSNWLNVISLCRKHHCIADGKNYHDV